VEKGRAERPRGVEQVSTIRVKPKKRKKNAARGRKGGEIWKEAEHGEGKGGQVVRGNCNVEV